MVQAGALINRCLLGLALASVFVSCNPPAPSRDETSAEKPAKKNNLVVPEFNADSTYDFVKTQVAFGPRVPNTKAHDNCANWFVRKLKAYGMHVSVQEGNVSNYDGKIYQIKNITGSFHPELTDRIVLFSHWDSRSIADQDSVAKDKPIDGADDGASGCAALLEIARQLQLKGTAMGIDLVFLDAEDTGEPENTPQQFRKEDTWCLGTQYWTKHLPENYHPRFGILLDMVGAKNAQFPMEGVSMEYASDYVKKIWNAAGDLGYSNFFLYTEAGPIIDDHRYINQFANIPTVDIINYNPVTGGFGFYHHTHADNMEIIDKSTLKAVGQTLLQVIYSETP